VTEAPSPAPEVSSEEQPRPTSWAFWRKRLGRLLILCTLLVLATQLLPAVPEDQFLEIRAPEGARFSRVEVTYYSGDDPVAGSQIRPTSPTPKLPHKVRLPSGDYSVAINAEGTFASGEAGSWSARREVSLDGATQAIQLLP
jgi:hypothetical protein